MRQVLIILHLRQRDCHGVVLCKDHGWRWCGVGWRRKWPSVGGGARAQVGQRAARLVVTQSDARAHGEYPLSLNHTHTHTDLHTPHTDVGIRGPDVLQAARRLQRWQEGARSLASNYLQVSGQRVKDAFALCRLITPFRDFPTERLIVFRCFLLKPMQLFMFAS